MPTNKQILLYFFLILNVSLVTLNVTGAFQDLWTVRNKVPLMTLTILNTTSNSPNLRGSSNRDLLYENATEVPASPPIHPFEQLSRKLAHFDWDPLRIDEVVRKYWDTERTFLDVIEERNANITILSTSCLHTAAWIVTGLLELQTRPNIYYGLYKRPKDKDLIVYDNTQDPVSTQGAPAIQSIRDFIESRPLNESIVLQVDMYQLQIPASNYYIDHHFAIHIYNGSISLYQGWQDTFNLIDWMKEPGAFKLRYPMPIDTFFTHFEKFATIHDETLESRERLEAIWKIFGTTERFVYGRKELLDSTVRALRYPWIVSLITHWPSPQPNETPVLS